MDAFVWTRLSNFPFAEGHRAFQRIISGGV